FLTRIRSAADGDDLGGHAGFAQAHGLFDGDLVEGVHRHLDAGQIDAGAVGPHTDLDVVIDYALDGYEDLQASLPECWPCIIPSPACSSRGSTACALVAVAAASSSTPMPRSRAITAAMRGRLAGSLGRSCAHSGRMSGESVSSTMDSSGSSATSRRMRVEPEKVAAPPNPRRKPMARKMSAC